MYKRFYNEVNATTNAEIFAQRVTMLNLDVSPAQVQGYFMINKLSTPETVIANVEQICDNSRKTTKNRNVAALATENI